MTRTILPGTLLLALSACAKPAAEDKVADPVALVGLAPATAGAVAARVTLYGQIEAGPGSDRTLSAPVEATVESIEAPVGTRVVPGTIVVRLKGSPASALDLTRAATDAATATAALARARRLRADGLVGDTEVETARAAAETANAMRASLGGRSSGLALRAGVAGVVDALLQKPGDLVTAGAAIARIAAAGGIVRARLGIDPALAAAIRPGSAIEVGALGSGATVRLTVSGVGSIVDPVTRLASVFVDVPERAGLAIGAPVSATLLRPGARGGVTIPYAAVLDDGGQPYAFVVAGGVAHRREVVLGPEDGSRVLVARGIGAGEPVIVAGGTAVEDGMKVRTR